MVKYFYRQNRRIKNETFLSSCGSFELSCSGLLKGSDLTLSPPLHPLYYCCQTFSYVLNLKCIDIGPLVNYIAIVIVERFWKSVFYIYSHIYYLTNHTYHYHIFTYTDTIPSGLHSFLKKNFYWSIVDLECCVNFCCIAKWLSCTHAYNLFYSFSLWFITGYWNIVPCAMHDDLVFCPSFLLIDLNFYVVLFSFFLNNFL